MALTLKYLRETVIPMLQREHEDPAALKKAIGAFLKQGEEEIPVVNEDGEPVMIEEIILVGADPDPEAEEGSGEGEGGGEAEITQASLDAAVQRALDAERSKLKRTKNRKTRITGGGFRNDEARTFGWKSVGDQLRAVKAVELKQGMDQRLLTKVGTGMSSAISSDGGFLLAPEFSDRIMEIVHEEDGLFAMTDNFQINSSTVKVNAIHETSRATGSRRGGVRAYWLAEGATLTASKPTFRQLTIEPQKLAVLVYATDEQLDDTGAMLEQLITRTAGEEINFLTGDAIINGTGAGQPLGILNAGATVSITKETGQTATTIVKANIDKMWARCHGRSRQNAVWLINQDVEPQLEALSADVGTGGVPVYLPAGGIAETPNARLKGRPVKVVEYCPTLGTVGDILLVDLSQYITATRGDVQSATSIHVQFTTDETAFRFTYRVDGQPWWSAALTPFKGTNTQSPFISLATRS